MSNANDLCLVFKNLGVGKCSILPPLRAPTDGMYLWGNNTHYYFIYYLIFIISNYYFKTIYVSHTVTSFRTWVWTWTLNLIRLYGSRYECSEERKNICSSKKHSADIKNLSLITCNIALEQTRTRGHSWFYPSRKSLTGDLYTTTFYLHAKIKKN